MGLLLSEDYLPLAVQVDELGGRLGRSVAAALASRPAVGDVKTLQGGMAVVPLAQRTDQVAPVLQVGRGVVVDLVAAGDARAATAKCVPSAATLTPPPRRGPPRPK